MRPTFATTSSTRCLPSDRSAIEAGVRVATKAGLDVEVDRPSTFAPKDEVSFFAGQRAALEAAQSFGPTVIVATLSSGVPSEKNVAEIQDTANAEAAHGHITHEHVQPLIPLHTALTPTWYRPKTGDDGTTRAGLPSRCALPAAARFSMGITSAGVVPAGCMMSLASGSRHAPLIEWRESASADSRLVRTREEVGEISAAFLVWVGVAFLAAACWGAIVVLNKKVLDYVRPIPVNFLVLVVSVASLVSSQCPSACCTSGRSDLP